MKNKNKHPICGSPVAYNKKTSLSAAIIALESEIDQMVYDLYGLTEEERKVVEESVG